MYPTKKKTVTEIDKTIYSNGGGRTMDIVSVLEDKINGVLK